MLDIKFTDYGNSVIEQPSYMRVGLVIMCNKSLEATIIHPVCNSKVQSIMIFVTHMIFRSLNGAFFIYIL